MIAVFTFVFVMMLIFEFSSHTVYGKLLTDEDVLDYLMRFEPFELNPFDKNIISCKINFGDDDHEYILHRIKNGKFISSNLNFTLSSKYYINGLGRVQRWSRGHYMIQELYKKLNQ
jgi:hypothetical protein